MEQVPDSTVDNDESAVSVSSSDHARMAPKLFLKAMPGGTFQSSPCSSHTTSSGAIKRSLPPLVPKPFMAKSATAADNQTGLIGRISGQQSTCNRSDDSSTTPMYLSNPRFLNSGTRNFLKPRKSLPALTPIGVLKQTASGSLLQCSEGIGYPITRPFSAGVDSSPSNYVKLQSPTISEQVKVTSGEHSAPKGSSSEKTVRPSITPHQRNIPTEFDKLQKPRYTSATPKHLIPQRNVHQNRTQAQLKPDTRIIHKTNESVIRPIKISTSRIPSDAALQRQIQREFETAAMSVQGIADKTVSSSGDSARNFSVTVPSPKVDNNFQNRMKHVIEDQKSFDQHQESTANFIRLPTRGKDISSAVSENETEASEKRSVFTKASSVDDDGNNKAEKQAERSCGDITIPGADRKASEEVIQDGDGIGRRTGRRRKPTKLYMTDFVPPTRRRKDNTQEVEVGGNDAPPGVHMDELEIKGDSPNDLMRSRGRPRGTGRGRGRPRGSTLKAKLERDLASHVLESMNTQFVDSMPLSSSLLDVEFVSDAGVSNPVHVLESTSPVTPRRPRGRGRGAGSTRGSQFISRGSRRGGRGSRGARGAARNILLAKRRAEQKILAPTVDLNIEVFEEETRMSADERMPDDVKKLLFTETIVHDEAPTVSAIQSLDEEASNLSSTSMSANTSILKTKKFTKDFIDERKPVTAETLFEYKWPPGSPDAEYYFLQEQIIEFLGHKSFRRKYPNLRRRCVEMEERDFLREQRIVSETQCDLGLTAVNSSEVLDILYSDFPVKYEEYRKIEVERREKELTRSQISTIGNGNNCTRDRSAEFIRRITKACAKWNSAFNLERKESRSYCFDLQTGTMNVPFGSMKACHPEQTKLGLYPVTVLPGQYSDGFKRYTPVELKYLPLNTVMYGPVQENRTVDDSDEGESDSNTSSTSDDTSRSSSSEDEGSDVEGNTDKVVCDTIFADAKDSEGICKTCNGDYRKNKTGRSEMLIHCAKCDSANHPTCLELSLDMVPYIKKYDWQCTDCKNCIECNDPADEDKMLFCDCCDRGYHIYCVGLRKVPTGRWHCVTCSVCHSCGVNDPSTDDRAAEWHHEFKKGEKGSKFYLHSHCVSCHKIYKKGQFCPTCLRCHLKLEDKSLVECRSCEKWVHKHCVKRPLQTKFGFLCESCEQSNFLSRTKLPQSRRN